MKIPTYTREVDVQTAAMPMANAEAMNAENQAIGVFGRQIEHAGEAGLRASFAYETLLKKQNENAALKAFNDNEEQKSLLQIEYGQKFDGMTNDIVYRDFRTRMEELDAKAAEGKPEHFKQYYQKLAEAHNTSKLKQFAEEGAQVLEATQTANLAKLVSAESTRAAAEGTYDTSSFQRRIDWVNDIIQNADISAVNKIKFTENAKRQMAETVFTSNLADEKKRQGFLDIIKDEKVLDSWLEKMAPEKRDNLIKLVAEAERAQKKVDTDQLLTIASTGLKSKYGDDYSSMIAALSKPSILKDYNLTVEQGAHLQNILKAEESYQMNDAAQKQTALKNAELDKIGELALKNPSAAIKLVRDSDVIRPMDKRQIIHNLSIPMPEGKSNTANYLSVLEKMYDPDASTEDKKRAVLSTPGITASDRKHLGQVGMSQERSSTKTAIAGSIKTFKAVMLTPGATSQTANERLDRAIKLLESDTRENKYTPSQVTGRANEILMMADFSNINPINDVKADMKRMRNVGVPDADEPSLFNRLFGPPKTPVPAKTVMIDGKEYKDGDIITQKDGTKGRVRITP